LRFFKGIFKNIYVIFSTFLKIPQNFQRLSYKHHFSRPKSCIHYIKSPKPFQGIPLGFPQKPLKFLKKSIKILALTVLRAGGTMNTI